MEKRVTVQYLPGFYIDVSVWIDGRLLAVTSDGPLVRCFLEPALVNPQPIWQQTATEPLLWLRQAVQGHLCLSVHQGQSGAAWLVGNGLARTLGPTFGVQPVGIDAHNAYVVSGPNATTQIGLAPQPPQPFPSGVPPDSGQGLSDVQPNGALWFADVHRTMVVNGWTFTYPNVRGPVVVGQVDGGIAAAVGGKVTLVIPSSGAFEPHVAVSPTGRVAICARTAQGAAYVATTIQELSV